MPLIYSEIPMSRRLLDSSPSGDRSQAATPHAARPHGAGIADLLGFEDQATSAATSVVKRASLQPNSAKMHIIKPDGNNLSRGTF
ncbi:MAG: hypothetical protein K6A67_05605 [Bacteroidales bacterium]|nr:hypothetical protein [Bacteroidales bacterium]